MWPRTAVRALLLAYVAYLTVAALGPAPSGPEIPHLDKIMHTLAWGALALGIALAWPGAPRRAVLLAAAHGALIEVLQGTVVEGRTAEFADFVADASGAGLAVSLLCWLQRQKGPKPLPGADE